MTIFSLPLVYTAEWSKKRVREKRKKKKREKSDWNDARYAATEHSFIIERHPIFAEISFYSERRLP